jgi:hypothetical protein
MFDINKIRHCNLIYECEQLIEHYDCHDKKIERDFFIFLFHANVLFFDVIRISSNLKNE